MVGVDRSDEGGGEEDRRGEWTVVGIILAVLTE